MDLQQYIASKKAPRKTPGDIKERWDNRVAVNGWHLLGENGVDAYFRAGYANNISAKKCLAFAFCALAEGATDMANGWFKKAAQLERVTLSDTGNPNNGPRPTVLPVGRPTETPSRAVHHAGFPTDRQPGRFSPMQPEDAAFDQSRYIQDDFYWGQPKLDGNKLIIFATPAEVFYQSREMNLRPTPNEGMDAALKSVANIMGNFVLEGELVYFDANGKEWMTAAEATKSNMKIGEPGRLPVMNYGVFACIWRTNDAELQTYGQMVELGERVAQMCRTAGCSIILPVYTARTREQKARLAADQKAHGREGEVWFIPSMPYRSGKNNQDNFVRTKYLKVLKARVTGFTRPSNPAYAFGAMCIESLDGDDLGNVGTGFTMEERFRLKQMFDQCGPFEVQIRFQSWTADGKPRHSRYLKVAS